MFKFNIVVFVLVFFKASNAFTHQFFIDTTKTSKLSFWNSRADSVLAQFFQKSLAFVEHKDVVNLDRTSIAKSFMSFFAEDMQKILFEQKNCYFILAFCSYFIKKQSPLFFFFMRLKSFLQKSQQQKKIRLKILIVPKNFKKNLRYLPGDFIRHVAWPIFIYEVSIHNEKKQSLRYKVCVREMPFNFEIECLVPETHFVNVKNKQENWDY